MSVRKPQMRDGHYCGQLTVQQQDNILNTISQSVIPKLKKMIFNFPADIIEEADKKDMSILTYLRETGVDCREYRGELRDYQTVGTGFMYLSPFSILGDGVGVGKTVELSALINMLRMTAQMNRVLIAVDPTAVGQTIKELKKFTGLYVVELPSLADKMRRVINKTDWSKVDLIVTKHTALKSNKFYEWLTHNTYFEEGTGKRKNNLYDVFILDESSIIKNPQTIQYTYTKGIVEMADRAHFLNATVFETNIMDIYYQMDMLNPVALPSKNAINNEFCIFTKDAYWKTVKGVAQRFPKFTLSGYQNEAIFKERLKLLYFGRSIKDVGLEGNNKYLVAEIMPTQNQLKAIQRGYRYNEVLNDPSLIPDIKMPTTVDNVPKLQRLIELCTQDFAESTILVYCFHKGVQYVMKDLLEQRGKRVGIINSDTKERDRQPILDKFNNGELDILITNSKRSLNLYNGDVCLMYSLEANPAKMEQIRGRIDRHVDDTQKVFVLMYYLLTTEYDLFYGKAVARNQAAKDLTIDSRSAVDFFAAAIEEGNQI